jgi:hypothetical protein
MNEAFLHYVWQCQYFDKSKLTTTAGEEVSILKLGHYNTDQGPDFSQAKIKIDGIEWVGHVEIHVNSSDWMKHAHQHDAAYDNVVLHVVWKHDTEITRTDGSVIPTLELCNRIDPALSKSYHKLVNSGLSIPCSKSFSTVGDIVKLSMFEKALTQRLRSKSGLILDLLKDNTGDWEETFYQVLCKNFGFKVNADAFFQLSKAVPYRLLKKHGNSCLQMEALLFGGAGMLEAKSKDEYVSVLFREFQLLQKKYSLAENQLHYSRWKFLRLRPANFPTLRIAQLAATLFHQQNIFSKIVELNDIVQLRTIFKAPISDYWHSHYRFGKKSSKLIEAIGDTSVDNIIINTVVPMLAAYAVARDEQALMEKAMRWLEQLPGEKNKITRTWAELDVHVKSSFDSQAMIEQYNNMCQKRNCLNCPVGASLLRPSHP